MSKHLSLHSQSKLLAICALFVSVIALLHSFLPTTYTANAAPSAQTIHAVNTSSLAYQGTLRDNTGKLLTGTYNLTFAIYDQPTGGIALHKEVLLGVIVRDGDFSVVLGADVNFPINSTVFAAQPRYMGIAIQPDPEMTPRQEIHVVPWALQANQALTVIDSSITTPKLADNSITSPKINDGGVNTDDLANGSVTSAKLADDVAKITLLPIPKPILSYNPTPYSVGQGWQDLVLSNVIPASAKAVLLDIGVAPNPLNGTVVRLSIKTPNIAYEPSYRVESSTVWDFGQGWVIVKNQAVEFELTGGPGNANFYVQLVGYME